jgi:hypothetical protein
MLLPLSRFSHASCSVSSFRAALGACGRQFTSHASRQPPWRQLLAAADEYDREILQDMSVSFARQVRRRDELVNIGRQI